jgi:hypothetical protein
MRGSLRVRSWRGVGQAWGWSALVCAILVLFGASPAAAAATPEKVRDRKGVDELQPQMSEDGFVWSQGDNSFVKPEHDPPRPAEPRRLEQLLRGDRRHDGRVQRLQEQAGEPRDVRPKDRERSSPPAGL